MSDFRGGERVTYPRQRMRHTLIAVECEKSLLLIFFLIRRRNDNPRLLCRRQDQVGKVLLLGDAV